MIRFTTGTDPEFFLFDGKEIISAIPIIPGTKFQPICMPSGGGLQHDNVLLEFSTPPSNSLKSFVESIRNSMIEATIYLPPNIKMVAIPSTTLSPTQLKDMDASRFGCDPDMDAWTECQNPTPHAPKGFRSGGAHIHIGSKKELETAFILDFERKMEFIKTMDYIIGIISTFLDFSSDAIKRKRLYGKAGSFRVTDYGIEYRVLSNFWMKSPKCVEMIYYLIIDCFHIFMRNEGMPPEIAGNEEKIITTINSGDIKTALDMYNTELKRNLNESSIKSIEMVKRELSSYDLYKEWKIG